MGWPGPRYIRRFAEGQPPPTAPRRVSLYSLFRDVLEGRADAPGLSVEIANETRAFTFGELDARSARTAALLHQRGLRPGDRLAVLLANRLEFVDLWLACLRSGVMLVPMNVLYTPRELAHIVGDAVPAAIVTSAERRDDLPETSTVWDVDELAGAATERAGQAAWVAADDATPAALVYTSGTTGAAKGAILTHGNFAANARALIAAWRIDAADRYLATLPLFHVHGLGNGLHCWLGSGCHMHLAERFERERTPALFERYRPTLFFGVPTMYVRLLELDAERARRIGATARLFVSGSAPLPAAVLGDFERRFGQRILERYGMTETLMTVSNPYDGERVAGTIGFPLPGTAVAIRDERGAEVAAGNVGELWIQGPTVCAGYWQQPEATAAAFVDGWFRTGDLGSRDASGRITLQGRRSELIISGGFNIHPREVEELLLRQPGVREAAVVGVPDAVRGELPVAFVVGDAELDVAALEAALRADLASFKVPRRFVRVEALPRTALGKVQRQLLAATVS